MKEAIEVHSIISKLHNEINVKKRFKRFNTYDFKELNAARNVVSSGILSNYLGV